MLTILLNLRAYVKKKLEESNLTEEQEEKKAVESSSSGNRRRKKRKSSEQLQSICENYQSENGISLSLVICLA
jgi:lipid II:glycine glycyltransferase (peptidoglycan interpeptide bridge formation enzyme)